MQKNYKHHVFRSQKSMKKQAQLPPRTCHRSKNSGQSNFGLLHHLHVSHWGVKKLHLESLALSAQKRVGNCFWRPSVVFAKHGPTIPKKCSQQFLYVIVLEGGCDRPLACSRVHLKQPIKNRPMKRLLVFGGTFLIACELGSTH